MSLSASMSDANDLLVNFGIDELRAQLLAVFDSDPPRSEAKKKQGGDSARRDRESIVVASAQDFEFTDAGNAQRFLSRFGRDVVFVPEWGWLAWVDTHWARDELRVRSKMIETARAIHEEAVLTVDVKRQESIAKWARQSQQARSIQSALWCAQPDIATSSEAFDGDTWLLPVLNGTIDLQTGDLLEHRREHMMTRVCPVSYDPAAPCPSWIRFLERVLPSAELRDFICRLAGYSLTGETSEQILIFLYGTGRNGKSVFVEILSSLMGEFHVATRIDTLASGRGGIPNDVAALAGARLVSVSETPEGVRLNESLVKDLTGGDRIAARFLRHEFFQFLPRFKLWVRGNHKPQIRGTDDGIWRRLALVPFTVQIPTDEVDPELTKRLRDELPGILAWAVRGCLDWERNGLQPPQQVIDAVSSYRIEMDALGEFMAARCIVSSGASAPASKLYASYRAWAIDSGHQPFSATRFGLALGERGFEKRKSGVVTWHGIGLVVDSPGQLDSLDTCSISTHTRACDAVNAEVVSELSNCPHCDGDGCGWCWP